VKWIWSCLFYYFVAKEFSLDLNPEFLYEMTMNELGPNMLFSMPIQLSVSFFCLENPCH
jgi:hypothetical protein